MYGLTECKWVNYLVVVDDGAGLTAQEIVRICRSKLENFMVPSEILLLDELPQTETGKIGSGAWQKD
jgi:acyl-coenzyme A synthetase/AMP-(fatty) acid ligase